MWTKNANLPNGYTTWQQALDYVAGMNNGTHPNFGYTDWRLPNRKELFSLIDFSQYVACPARWAPFFTNVQASYYWSSTSYIDGEYAKGTGTRGSSLCGDGNVDFDDKSTSTRLRLACSRWTGWPLDHWAISGTVTGAVQQGVTMTLSGTSSATTTTDGSGNYSFSDLSNGNYTVTPTLAGYTFSPTSKPVKSAEQT